MESMYSHPIVLFHSQCMDGLVAAWVAWRRYFERAEYIPVRYGQKPPDCSDRLVYVLDFCYSPEDTAALADQASRVIIMDHHKTSIDRFEQGWKPRPDVETIFDLGRSGAGITSDYFNAQARVWIVDYAEDRDLWRWKLPHSREINALLAASCLGKPPTEAFHLLNELRGLSMKQVIAQGTGAQLQIECYARQVATEAQRITFAGHANIPLVNLPKPMASEVLHALLDDRTPFAAGWRQEGTQAVFSLRSANGPDSFDVAKLAERFGGGGHRNAAGFSMTFHAVEEFIMGKVPAGREP
jgi:uncharacterized protein